MNYLRYILFIIFVLNPIYKSFSQQALKNYKYILIQSNYDGNKKLNNRRESFNINHILKKHLNNKNFITFIQDIDKIPLDINPCAILKARINDSGFTVTKISIKFIDCYGNNIYTTKESISRIKDFKLSYFDAFKKTLSDPNIKKHQYIKK